jgi:WD40 repeat protein
MLEEGDDEWKSDSDHDEDGDDEGDITAKQAQNGRDIQGIPWEQVRFTRERYRENRLQHYNNYVNLEVDREVLDKQCKRFSKGGQFYGFQLNTRKARCTIVHFQLRNLVWATSKHDVYVMHNNAVHHWNAVSRKATEVLNLDQPRGVQISTMCVHKNLLVVGGFSGELVAKDLNQKELIYSTRIAHDDSAITNAVEIFDMPGMPGGTRVLTSNNDSVVRLFDVTTFKCLNNFRFEWAVNYAVPSPDRKMLAVVGDSPAGILADFSTGKPILSLEGHLDFSFAVAWHPEGNLLATGNQDSTTRLWDVRNTKEAITVLQGRIGAIRALRFSNDGKFLAMAEPLDFVHLFDLKDNCNRCQEIDLFGEVAGVAFSPDCESFFVGTEDLTYGSLLEFNRFKADRDDYYFP